MKYSYNQNKEGVVFAHTKDINASFKDLGAVCDFIRYRKIPNALQLIDEVIAGRQPILYRTHNKHMGARHELGGRKGRTPIKCAKIVKKVLINAAANARNMSYDTDNMAVVHAASNKTIVASRYPPKGALFTTGGPTGYVSARNTDLSFAKVEIGVSEIDDKRLSVHTVKVIKRIEEEDKRKIKHLEAQRPKKIKGADIKKGKAPLIKKATKEKEAQASAPASASALVQEPKQHKHESHESASELAKEKQKDEARQ